MKIQRRFTKTGQDAYADLDFVTTESEIRNPDGTIVFHLDDIEVPASWSQVASDVIAQKYFRKAGVPAKLRKVREKGVPEFLWRSVPANEDVTIGGETSAKQVFDRLAGAWTYWGWKGGYFSTEDDARAYFDEMRYMLATQRAAPNSPQWFNTGLHWAYGIDGPSQGHYYVDYKTGKLTKSKSAYEHPQPHACFIQSVADDLVGEGGIMDLWVREARLFKYGSGTGTNFSSLRADGESLSGGGKSSGLMGFLKIGDRAAGAIKSGGTTRRAAKMVIVDADHPDIEEYINWKVKEEQKVASIVAGSKMHEQKLNGIFDAIKAWDGAEADAYDAKTNDGLKSAIRDPNPVIFLENEILYGKSFDVPVLEDFTIPFGKARVWREGEDVTIVSWGIGMTYALEAAEKLAEDGIEAEVIDLRTLRPMDTDTVLKSVMKTNRCVTVEEGWPQGSVGGYISGVIMQEAFDYLDAPVITCTGKDVPMPYAANLEKHALVTTDEVIEAVRKVTYR